MKKFDFIFVLALSFTTKQNKHNSNFRLECYNKLDLQVTVNENTAITLTILVVERQKSK